MGLDSTKQCVYCSTWCDYPDGMEDLGNGNIVCKLCASELDPTLGTVKVLASTPEWDHMRTDAKKEH